MLRRLSIRGFRALKNVTLDLPTGVPTVFIGPNGSGKTTILEAVEFLRDVATSGIRPAVSRREGIEAIVTRGGEAGHLGFEVEYDASVGSTLHRVRYGLTVAVLRDSWGVETERLGVVEGDSTLDVVDRRPDRCTVRESLNAEPRSVGASQYKTLLEEWIDRTDGGLPSTLLTPLRRSQYFPPFDARANWMRRPDDPTRRVASALVDRETELDPLGSNLLNVLHTLHSDPDRRPLWQRLLQEFQREFPYVGEVSFAPTGGRRGQIAAQWKDSRTGQRMYFDEMSDGMLVYLSLLTAIFTVGEVKSVAFDEPDLHMHPSLLARVVDLLEDCAERQTVLIATHSDRLLDFLSEAHRSIHIVEHGSAGGVTVRRPDESSLKSWLERYRVSEVRQMGMLDMAGEGAAP